MPRHHADHDMIYLHLGNIPAKANRNLPTSGEHPDPQNGCTFSNVTDIIAGAELDIQNAFENCKMCFVQLEL